MLWTADTACNLSHPFSLYPDGGVAAGIDPTSTTLSFTHATTSSCATGSGASTLTTGVAFKGAT
jgi:hypothetical protein